MRAERESLSLLHFLRDQGQPQSEWLAALSADQTLPPKADRGGSANAPCNSPANGSRRLGLRPDDLDLIESSLPRDHKGCVWHCGDGAVESRSSSQLIAGVIHQNANH